MSDSLVGQVREAIAERRKQATETRPRIGVWRPEENETLAKHCRCLSCWEIHSWSIDQIDGIDHGGCEWGIHLSREDAVFIAANDPASVLRLCDGAESLLDDSTPDIVLTALASMFGVVSSVTKTEDQDAVEGQTT